MNNLDIARARFLRRARELIKNDFLFSSSSKSLKENNNSPWEEYKRNILQQIYYGNDNFYGRMFNPREICPNVKLQEITATLKFDDK